MFFTRHIHRIFLHVIDHAPEAGARSVEVEHMTEVVVERDVRVRGQRVHGVRHREGACGWLRSCCDCWAISSSESVALRMKPSSIRRLSLIASLVGAAAVDGPQRPSLAAQRVAAGWFGVPELSFRNESFQVEKERCFPTMDVERTAQGLRIHHAENNDGCAAQR